jgi:hypothetical protein
MWQKLNERITENVVAWTAVRAETLAPRGVLSGAVRVRWLIVTAYPERGRSDHSGSEAAATAGWRVRRRARYDVATMTTTTTSRRQ